jgi:DNA polymerase-3 subunit epsilon
MEDLRLNLQKPLIVFDIESTGVSVCNDRIVQLAIIKVNVDGSVEEKCRLINPTIPIPKEASEIHGITDDMVKNEPTFGQIAKGLVGYIGNSDLCGFNSNRFDVPLLLEEFHRAGVPFDMTNRKTIDVWKIFQKMEPRNLSAAFRFYCGKKLENAHDALADSRATLEVLKGQIKKYEGVDYNEGEDDHEIEPVRNDMDSLNEFSNFKGKLDFAGRIVLNNEGVEVFNFGKYQDQPVVNVLKDNPGYYRWFMNADFTTDSKNLLKEIKEKNKL